jgi:creatinine amidohydrolase
MIAAISDWCASLRRHGFERIYWFNGHGGNVATIAAAFAEIHAARSLDGPEPRQPALRLQQRNWWEMPAVAACCRRLHPQNDGAHATASEIAVTWAVHPDRVSTLQPEPRVAPMGSFGDALDYRARFPDGRIGSDPTQASVAAGEEIIAVAAQALREEFATFAAG